MIDWIRNVRKSTQEKREESVAAYIDNELSVGERAQFERDLSNDASMQAELEAQREMKRLLSELPNVRAPRNFTLDPAVYGKQKPTPSFLGSIYPQLRTASAVAALCLVALIGYASLSPLNGSFESTSAPLAASSEEQAIAVAPTIILEQSESADEAFELATMPTPTATTAAIAEASAIEKDLAEAEMADDADSGFASPRESDSSFRVIEENGSAETAAGNSLPEAELAVEAEPNENLQIELFIPDESADQVDESISAIPVPIEDEPQIEINVEPSTSFWTTPLGLVMLLLVFLTIILFVLTFISRSQRRL